MAQSVPGEDVASVHAWLREHTVEEILEVTGVEHISGIESDRNGGFWIGGENGKLRRVKRRVRL